MARGQGTRPCDRGSGRRAVAEVCPQPDSGAAQDSSCVAAADRSLLSPHFRASYAASLLSTFAGNGRLVGAVRFSFLVSCAFLHAAPSPHSWSPIPRGPAGPPLTAPPFPALPPCVY